MKNTVKKSQKGFTLIELLIVIAVIAILAAIAIPNLLSSRKAANEASAIGSIRTMVSAQETYRSRQTPPSYGTPAQLGAASLIDSLLQGGSKSGYTFTTVAGNDTYTVSAAPTNANTGDRSFFVDQSGVIRAASTGAATVASSPIQ